MEWRDIWKRPGESEFAATARHNDRGRNQLPENLHGPSRSDKIICERPYYDRRAAMTALGLG
jgi:hypothetical protein